ncbi:MAG: hypothetical protein M0Q89_00425 [Methanothrix soehngenii]|uniref:hypothetical protein n=1 Tax=Methanothrix soehngenii TaxID=2223 RepID=UPI0023F27134|nr:hypothetical protein [Methanothrix soehngenii]MCK9585322.1 hypothetical protein [Methanothrix soehngenii]MDD5256331.1 hypothetical protein [Methanothrix soehngenii]
MLLIIPLPPEGIKVLIKLQNIPGPENLTLFYHCHLDIKRQDLEDPQVVLLGTKMGDELPPQPCPILCLRGHQAEVYVAIRPGIAPRPGAVEQHS